VVAPPDGWDVSLLKGFWFSREEVAGGVGFLALSILGFADDSACSEDGLEGVVGFSGLLLVACPFFGAEDPDPASFSRRRFRIYSQGP
jgi:hypothetical protein